MPFFIITDNSPQMEGGEVVSDMEQASAQNNGFDCVHCGKIFTTNVVMKNHIKHVQDKIKFSNPRHGMVKYKHCQSQLERPAAQLLAEENSVNTGLMTHVVTYCVSLTLSSHMP